MPSSQLPRQPILPAARVNSIAARQAVSAPEMRIWRLRNFGFYGSENLGFDGSGI